jgi:hypothetical protein
MALTEAQKRKIEEEEGYRAKIASSQQTVQVKSSQKHGVPAILSFFIPGLGQIVKAGLHHAHNPIEDFYQGTIS